MPIVDQYGNPLRPADIAEPQTARIMALQHRVIESQIDGITPARAASILREADTGNLLAQTMLFDDMLDRDAHLRGEFEKRSGAIQTLDWRIAPPPDASAAEKSHSAWVEDVLRNAVDDLEDTLAHMMEAVGYGFAPVELEWLRVGSERLPRFNPRPQTWFQLDMNRRALRLVDGSGDGAEPVSMGWILHQAKKVKTGYLGRAGIFRPAIWPFIYKAYSVGDFAEFLEIYGLPIIVGKFSAGSNHDEKASLMRAVAALGRDARAIMPDTMALEIKEVTGSGAGSPHLAMVDWADRAQSKLILGQVLSAEAKATGMGSGVANLHGEVRHDILVGDARQIAATLTRDLVYPLLAINRPGFDGMRRCPRFEFDLGEAEDLKLFSDALPKLAEGGAQIPVSWVHEKLRIPRAAEGEAIFGSPAAMPAGAAAPLRGAAAMAAKAYRPVGIAREDELAVRLAVDSQPAVDDWVAEIGAMLADADSLETFRERLLTAYPNLDRARMVEAMSAAFMASHLFGIDDVGEGR